MRSWREEAAGGMAVRVPVEDRVGRPAEKFEENARAGPSLFAIAAWKAALAFMIGASGDDGVPAAEVQKRAVSATTVASAGANVSITAEMAVSSERLRRERRDPEAPEALDGFGAEPDVLMSPDDHPRRKVLPLSIISCPSIPYALQELFQFSPKTGSLSQVNECKAIPPNVDSGRPGSSGFSRG